VTRLPIFLLALVAVLTFAPAAARAQSESGISGSVTLVSDYRFRGASLSNREPALQGGIEFREAGWVAGVWASTAENLNGPGAELDLYAGRTGVLGGFDYSVTAYAYVFEGQPVYFEGQVAMERDLGPASLQIEFAYAPPQQSVRENIYLGAGITLPVTSHVALFGRGGIERSYFFGDKRDWEAGARWTHGPFTLAASVVGAEGDFIPLGDRSPTTLFSVTTAW
jgi:uncharacterized protein (TIGR02001 family)